MTSFEQVEACAQNLIKSGSLTSDSTLRQAKSLILKDLDLDSKDLNSEDLQIIKNAILHALEQLSHQSENVDSSDDSSLEDQPKSKTVPKYEKSVKSKQYSSSDSEQESDGMSEPTTMIKPKKRRTGPPSAEEQVKKHKEALNELNRPVPRRSKGETMGSYARRLSRVVKELQDEHETMNSKFIITSTRTRKTRSTYQAVPDSSEEEQPSEEEEVSEFDLSDDDSESEPPVKKGRR
ncbi:hypothetical protein P9112_004375 [Eukaryota sp. TZLM1-RC]